MDDIDMDDVWKQIFTVKGVSIAHAKLFNQLASIKGKSREDFLEDMIEHYTFHLLNEDAAKRAIRFHKKAFGPYRAPS